MIDRSRTERVSMNPEKTVSSSPTFPIPVGFVVSTLVTGGAERQLQHLILNLDRKRFEPHLYTLRGPGPIGDLIASRGIPVESNLGPGRPPVPWSPLKLARRQRRVGLQIYYCLDHTNAVTVAVLASKLAGRIPILMPVHTTGQWNRASIPKPMKMVLGSVTQLLSIADAQKQYLVESEHIPPEKITVIRNGIPPLDPAALPSKQEARGALGISPDDGPVVGILAMLRPEKAHENFLNAAQQLLHQLPKSIFLIVGGGPRQAELEELAARLGIAPRVRFLGVRSDVPRILPAFDLSVLASHPCVETLPLSQMEAMSLGIPVVATRVGALHELVNDGVEGRLVPPGDPAALADAMAEILSDPERARAAGQAARERILKEFTATRMARETEEAMMRALRE
ncbi:MAG: glycosyltransferase [Candidatus Eisenbacteria sp.]|nr:glycosyltransferase [Candidatus Eisenbacteria bacterium]